MSKVVIIHAAEDTLPARALAEKLRLARLTVAIETPPGAETRSAAQASQVVVALWSPRSIGQAGIADDVAFLRGRSKLVHASMQNAAPPAQFQTDRTVNLTGWRGEDDFPAWRELARVVTDAAGVAPLAPPAPRPPSGFFTPGRASGGARAAAPERPQQPRAQPTASVRQAPPAPRQSSAPPQPRMAQPPRQAAHTAEQFASSARAEPAEKRSGGAMVLGLIALLVLGAGGGGYYFWSQSQAGGGAVNGPEAAWEEIDSSDVSALRTFIDGAPGDYLGEAQAALAALEESTFEAAMDANTIDAFEEFLRDFPGSRHAAQARDLMAALQGEPAPAAASVEATPDQTPTAPPAPDAEGGPAPLTPPSEEQPAGPPPDAPPN